MNLSLEQPLLTVPRQWKFRGSKKKIASEPIKIELLCRGIAREQMEVLAEIFDSATSKERGHGHGFDPWVAMFHTGRLPINWDKSAASYCRPFTSWFTEMSCSAMPSSSTTPAGPPSFDVTIAFNLYKKGLPMSYQNSNSPFRMVLMWHAKSLAIVTPPFDTRNNSDVESGVDLNKFSGPKSKAQANAMSAISIPVRLPVHEHIARVPSISNPGWELQQNALRIQRFLQAIINPELLSLQEAAERAVLGATGDASPAAAAEP